ncbi:MerR family transcriptional regulator [Oceanobacillus sp. FSL H7-0719]|uniref:MerR family transcriptional regulator n=1 Tax=Oceanobacillus sp. FSL H7-0719 TaxID=2954507 RepID=UPI003254C207
MNDRLESDPLLDFSLIKKLIVGIGEVSDITGVPTRKIRYWEDKGAISSEKDFQGSTRRFDYWNIKKILLIQELMEEGYTLDAAAEKVQNRTKEFNQAFYKLANSLSNNETD